MKINDGDYSKSVVAINALARELQKKAAVPNNEKAVYKLATDIMLECQEIRDLTKQEPKTLSDYIKSIFK